MTSDRPDPTMRIEFCTSWGYDQYAVSLADHMLQTRPKDVQDGIMLAPCPPGVTGEYRVIWRGEVIYEKTPEEWKFPEPARIVEMIDAAG